jgi:uncharacterized circularly permuted ATP-grasp superfamily protein
MRSARQHAFILLLAVITSLSAAADQAFDETRHKNGTPRTIYSEFLAEWQAMPPSERKAYLEDSKKAFSGDNSLDPMPRVLSAREYDEVRNGVEQRARALLAFLNDHYSGRKTYQSHGLISAQLVEKIIARHHERDYHDLLKGKPFSFIYGPDLIRDPDGNWRVLEDNPGFVGGTGDLELAQSFYLDQFPQIRDRYKFRRASDFYDRWAERMHQAASRHGGIAIAYAIKPFEDHEDHRFMELMAQRGIETVTAFSKKQMDVRDDGVYLGRKKVGFVYMIGDHVFLDPSDPVSHRRFVLDHALFALEHGYILPTADKEILRRLIQDLQKDLSEENDGLLQSWSTQSSTGPRPHRKVLPKESGA